MSSDSDIESLIGRSAILSFRESARTIEMKAMEQRLSELESLNDVLADALSASIDSSDLSRKRLSLVNARTAKSIIIGKMTITILLLDIIFRAVF